MALPLYGVLIVALILLAVSLLVRPSAIVQDEVGKALWGSAMRVLRDLGIAGLIAAGSIAIYNQLAAFFASTDTIGSLDRQLSLMRQWQGLRWVVLVLLAAIFLLAALRVAADREAQGGSRLRPELLRWLAGLFGVAMFASAVANANVPSALADAQAERAALVDAQGQLFRKVQMILVREAIDAVVTDIAAANPGFDGLSKAFTNSAAFVDPALGTGITTLADVTPLAPLPQPDPAPNASIDDIRAIDTVVVSSDSAAPLVDSLFKTVFSKTSVRTRPALAGLGQPSVNYLVGALDEPAFADAVRAEATRQAQRVIRREITWDTATEAMRAVGVSLAARLRGGVAAAGVPAAAGGFGDPLWDPVRRYLDGLISGGIPGRSSNVQQKAYDANSDKEQFQQDTALVLAATPGRPAREEAAFARYLGSQPFYAALWGYAIGKSPPPLLKDRLRQIAIQGMSDRTGAGQALSAADDSGPDSQRALAQLALTAGNGAASLELRNRLYDQFGAAPVDGYILYFRTVLPGSAEKAGTYFRSQDVNDAVDLIAPPRE